MADYPSSITALFTDVVSGQIVDVSHVNRMKEELIAVQTELGVDPAGGYSDVKTNLVIANRDALTILDPADLISVYDTSDGKNKKIPYSGIAPVSYLQLNTFSGLGSSSTKIPYFSTVVLDVDTASSWTYVNNSTLGLAITIDVTGFYVVSFTSNQNGAGFAGISVNSNQLTTNIQSITVGHRRALTTVAINETMNVCVGMYLASGDVVRPHISGNVANTNDQNHFEIIRVI